MGHDNGNIHERKAFSFKGQLIAVSALARYWKNICHCDFNYYAGMWSLHFPWQLLWSVEADIHCRREENGAPTWSWASVDGAVQRVDKYFVEKVGRHMWSILVNIKEVKMNLVSDDEFGLIKGGRLTLSTRLARLWAAKHKINFWNFPLKLHTAKGTLKIAGSVFSVIPPLIGDSRETDNESVSDTESYDSSEDDGSDDMDEKITSCCAEVT